MVVDVECGGRPPCTDACMHGVAHVYWWDKCCYNAAIMLIQWCQTLSCDSARSADEDKFRPGSGNAEVTPFSRNWLDGRNTYDFKLVTIYTKLSSLTELAPLIELQLLLNGSWCSSSWNWNNKCYLYLTMFFLSIILLQYKILFALNCFMACIDEWFMPSWIFQVVTLLMFTTAFLQSRTWCVAEPVHMHARGYLPVNIPIV